MRWDLQFYLRLDLNDWLRGDRDWQDLWDLKDQLPTGSKYKCAKLSAPETVEVLIEADDSELSSEPNLEDFDLTAYRLANIEDRLTQILYATAQTDPSRAPRVGRPELPHMKERRKRRSKALRHLMAKYDTEYQ